MKTFPLSENFSLKPENVFFMIILFSFYKLRSSLALLFVSKHFMEVPPSQKKGERISNIKTFPLPEICCEIRTDAFFVCFLLTSNFHTSS